jgi:GNAT superfamily N-acetyltransferase
MRRLQGEQDDRYPVSEIRTQPVSNDGRRRGFRLYYALDHPIHAVGAPVLERIFSTMRRTIAGCGAKDMFLCHPTARQQGMPGMAGLEGCETESPELGLWMKESAHGQGFGREVVAAVAEWAHKTLGKKSFIYPVAVQNTASRRIAEGLHGEIIENRMSPKYESVVYKIPWKG